MKRWFRNVVIIIAVALFTFVVIDYQVLRGYFLLPIFYRETFKTFNGNVKYSVIDNHNGTYDLSLKNEDLAYYPIILYREEALFNLSDTVLFRYATRFIISSGNTNLFDTDGGFDCGTGIGEAFIRPFESFELKGIKLEEFSGNFTYAMDSVKKWNLPPDSISNLELRFYLPVFSLGEEGARVYSNKIEFGDDRYEQLK